MDKSVPPGAAVLLDFIGGIEAPAGYDTIFGNNQGKLAKPLTTMTFGEVVDAGKSWTRRFKSSAAGRYQFMRATLIGIAKELRSLSGTDLFDADLQDRLGYYLLKRRGYADFMAGKIDRVEFGRRLAMEWASLPVLKATKGRHRDVARGQSYYTGDPLNKSLISPAKVEAVLRKAKAAGNPAPSMPRADTEALNRIERDQALAEAIENEVAARERPASREPKTATERTDRVTVEIVQRKLWDLGYTEVGSRDPKTGAFDGKIGAMTRTAILAFRNENGLPVSDAIDDELLVALDAAKPRSLPRGDASIEDIRNKVPEVHSSWLLRIGASVLAAGSAAGALFDGVVSNLGLAKGYLADFSEYVGDVPGWAKFGLLAAVAAGAYLIARRGEKKGVEAWQEGARR